MLSKKFSMSKRFTKTKYVCENDYRISIVLSNNRQPSTETSSTIYRLPSLRPLAFRMQVLNIVNRKEDVMKTQVFTKNEMYSKLVFVFSMVLLLAVTACGNSKQNNIQVGACKYTVTDLHSVVLSGSWVMTESSNINTFKFNDDCSFTMQGSGTMSSQSATGTFGNAAMAGTIFITVSQTTAGFAYPASIGNKNLSYNDVTTGQLVIDFADGTGSHTFIKQ